VLRKTTASAAPARSTNRVVTPRRTKLRVLKAPAPDKAPPLEPEATDPHVAATIWLRGTLPAAIPPALPLSARFAADLRKRAAKAGADWALVLATLRVQGADGAVPGSRREVTSLADDLSGLRQHSERFAGVLALTGRAEDTDRTLALARYYRVIGLEGLIKGLASQRWELVQTVLQDPRVQIYDGGRLDLSLGHVDVRVVALIEYLADTFGEVTVSSLISGHRLYARPGVVSAHVYGRAVDIAALGGIPIYGHQQPGGVTEQGVKQILLLPPEMMPNQVISLLGLGGPSFPLADHYNHVHVGY
jgi:hypothetical protein